MKKFNQLLLLFICLFAIQFSFGQTLEDALGFEETVNDVPEAPINLFIGLAIAIGSYIGIKRLK